MRKKDKCSYIEGENLYLRKIKLSDVNGKYLGWMNDGEVNQYLESRFEKWSINKLRDYIGSINKNPDYVFLGIFIKDTDRHIGNIKLGPINKYHKFADIGIIIGDKDCWGKGFASEAIRLITDYAVHTLKLHKLTAGAYVNNVGSVKAFKKAGFRVEGIRAKHYLYKGEYIDAAVLGIVRR